MFLAVYTEKGQCRAGRASCYVTDAEMVEIAQPRARYTGVLNPVAPGLRMDPETPRKSVCNASSSVGTWGHLPVY